MAGESHVFHKAPENSIEVYDDTIGRNTILTRSARMRKFKFYQYKPIYESPTSSPSQNNAAISKKWNDNAFLNNLSRTSQEANSSPILLPRDEIVQGKVNLSAEQSKELTELDEEIIALEKRITSLSCGGGGDIDRSNTETKKVENLDEIFELVNRKNDLLRRQMQLNITEQDKALEKANEELTKELRSLMSMDDSRKTASQLERQKYLYEQSIMLVNKRNELLHHMDLQEKGIEEDNALKETLRSVTQSSSLGGRSASGSQDQNCIIQ